MHAPRTPSVSRKFTARALAVALGAGTALTLVACAVEPPDTDPNDLTNDEEVSTMDSELTSNITKGDWKKFPDGLECLPAVQGFYPAKFGVSLPIAGPGSFGNCAA